MENLQDLIGFLNALKTLNRTKIEIDSVLKKLIEIQEKQLTIPVVVKSSYCKCIQPSMQKPISETEYECFDCGEEVRQ